jgi:hypothetical protein
MKKIIGAERAGEYGIMIQGKTAIICQNRGGAGKGFIEEGTLRATRQSGCDAFFDLADRLGWSAEYAMNAYAGAIA